jgi:hypothetical protein
MACCSMLLRGVLLGEEDVDETEDEEVEDHS